MNGGHEFIQKLIERIMSQANTAALGMVESYAEGRASVTVYPDKELIENVPVCFPQAAGFYMHFPLKIGDLVLVIFAQHEIEGPLFSEEVSSNRKKDINDAIIIPAIGREGEFPAGADPDAFTIGSRSGAAKVVIREDTIEISATGGVNVTGSSTTGSW